MIAKPIFKMPRRPKRGILLMIVFAFLCFSACSCQSETIANSEDYKMGTSINLTESQNKRVSDLLNNLAYSGIHYNFSEVNEIALQDLCSYLNYASMQLFSLDDLRYENESLTGWLDKEQVLLILLNDFGLNKLPYRTVNENEFAWSTKYGENPQGYSGLEITGYRNLIFAKVDYEFRPDNRLYNRPGPNSEMIIYQTVVYSLEMGSDGTIKIKSGKVL